MADITTELWNEALTALKEIIDPEEFTAWFSTLEMEEYSLDNREVRLTVATDFYRRWLTRKYIEQIHAVFEDALGHPVQISINSQVSIESSFKPASQSNEFTVSDLNSPEFSRYKEQEEDDVLVRNRGLNRPTPVIEEVESPSVWRPDQETKPETAPVHHRHNLNPRYTFEDFVVGESNRYAHAAAQSVADPDSSAFNPLFIYGQSGLGKTHLMQAIGQKYISRNPMARILYVTSEQFINGFIESIQKKKSAEFRNQYRKVDVLLLDDVQFLIGKERTQQEIFHTFNDLFDAGKKIVLTSDRPPKELTTLEDRLRSRFEWGLIADMATPDLETRIAILRQKAINERITVPDEVITHIAESVTDNIREMEGALKRIKVYASLHNCPVTTHVAQDVLRPIMSAPLVSQINVDQIQSAVCEYFNISSHQLLGSNRSKKFSFPRHIALYLCRELTNLSFPDIAQKFGGKDHTSVIYACRKIKNQVEKDQELAQAIEQLIQSLQNKNKQS